MDILGRAMLDYFHGNYTEDIITETTISEKDVLPLPYLFRDYDEMPLLEQKALDMSKGKVLDVGCGAGIHGLYLQNKRNLEVSSIDISQGAIETCKLRGLDNARVQDLFELKNESYDTVLLLMNGLGICGTLDRIDILLQHLRSLLNPGGQVLLDSSDIIYMYEGEEEEGVWLDPSQGYYGQLQFTTHYKEESCEPFDWLYLDYNTLQNAAHNNGFNCELVQEGEHYDYLARLTLNK